MPISLDSSSLSTSLEPFRFFHNPSEIPSQLPLNLHLDNGHLYEGGWKNGLQRFFVPGYASSQDAKISQLFISFFSNFLHEGFSEGDRAKIKGMLMLAEQHISRSQSSFFHQNFEMLRLGRYTLAARKRLQHFEPEHPFVSLKEKCLLHNRSLFTKWTHIGFSEEVFWSSPDLVDFVFKSYLHRHIAHPHYNHPIPMQSVCVQQGRNLASERQPHLLMNGRWVAWSQIKKSIQLDRDERLYSIENGVKKYWMYLDEGLTKWDRNHFDTPHRLYQLSTPPQRSRIEVITTHAHPEDWHLGDRFLKGSRHAYFRIVPGRGFDLRHSETGMKDGSVYSLGWGARWRDFSLLQPLSTLRGKWVCPDGFEFFKEDLCITPIDITDAQMIRLFEIVKKRSKEEYPFNVITANCCGGTADVLKEAGIVTLSTKMHFASILYKFIFPKSIRHGIDSIGAQVEKITPSFVGNGFQKIAGLTYSAVFAPLFTLLGAWRTNLSFENEDGARAIASNQIKALFSNVFDFFSPNKMEFDLTKNVYKWQKKQTSSYFEKHN